MNTFGRRVGVEFFGDAAPLERSFANVAAATKEYGALSVATNAKVTDAQIAGTVKQIESLRAQQAEFAAAATSGVRSAKEQEAAQIRLAAVSRRLAAVTGESTAATVAFASGTRTVERDLGKTTRGVLAGSGVFGRFGRSLAFASTGFIAVATGATLIREAITSAESLAKAQDSLSVAIRHTGGNVAKLEPEYAATAKAAAQFGVSQLDATTGLARATVLTGSAAKAQRAYQEALVISKATGKDFNTVLLATSKGQAGITTSLRRYGVLVKAGSSGTAQFTQVMERFGGQAAANTTETDKLRAVFANTEVVIGKALLPTFERLAASLAAWLTKMQKSGQLQKDVNEVMHVTGDVFHTLGKAIGIVDDVTGSFKNTLELLVAIKFASVITGWIGVLEALAAKWGVVQLAAEGATAAETAAASVPATAIGARGVAAGAAGAGEVAGAAGIGALLGRGGFGRGGFARGEVARIKQYTKATEDSGSAAARAGAKSEALSGGLTKLGARLVGVAVAISAFEAARRLVPKETSSGNAGRPGPFISGIPIVGSVAKLGSDVGDAAAHGIESALGHVGIHGHGSRGQPIPLFFDPQFIKFGRPFTAPGFANLFPKREGQTAQGPFGTAKPQKTFTQQFQLTPLENLSAAQSSLTRTTTDDVAAAKQVVARVKKLIDQGRLSGKALIQALQAEAAALGTIWSAEDAAAQKRAAKVQAAKARIQAQIENSIDPLKLEVGLSQAQALGKPLLPYLKALRAAAEKAIASGKLSLAQQKEAYDQITSLNQQIKDAATTASVTFAPSAKLQLALAKDEALGLSPVNDLLKLKAAILKFIRTHKKNTAALIDAYQQLGAVTQQLAGSFTLSPRLQFELARDQALGRDTTKDLLKMRAAILKFIRTHKHNFAALTDAYNQLRDINDQLGSTAQSALGLFKQASTKALTAGLNLTAEQRKALRQRLAGLGPGQTVSGSGVGAAGYAIDPKTGRPIALHRHQRRLDTAASGGGGGGRPLVIDPTIDLNVYIDGHQVEATVTKRQQKRTRRNPHQRRGPNAGG